VSRADVDVIIGYLRQQWPRMKVEGELLVEWYKALEHVPLSQLQVVTAGVLREDESAPKLATIVKRLGGGKGGRGRASRGTAAARALPRGPAPKGCPDCARQPGWREMARHFERNGLAEVRVVIAKCDCELGASMAGAAPPFREVLDAWTASPATTRTHVTHRELPVLEESMRHTPAAYARILEMRDRGPQRFGGGALAAAVDRREAPSRPAPPPAEEDVAPPWPEEAPLPSDADAPAWASDDDAQPPWR